MRARASTRAVLLGAFALAVAACVPVAPRASAPAQAPAAPVTLAPTTTSTTSTTTTTTTTVPTLPACSAAATGASAQAAAGTSVVALVRQNGSLRIEHHVASSRADANSLVQHLRARSDVVAADVDQPVHALDVPGPDPMRAQQWALDRIPFEATWTATPGSDGTGVTVAVIDTGVRSTHEDLNDGRVLAGNDFVNPSGGDGSDDQNGHGTFVAGIIAAENGNSLGISGAAPGVKLLPVRVLDGSGNGSYAAVEAGITWATDHGANVINMSLGGTAPSSTLEAAVQYAVDHGVTVVMAAGNDARCGTSQFPAGNPVMYPADYSTTVAGAIAVGATDVNDAIGTFSSHGSYVDLSAPGVDIDSTWGRADTAYASGDGTSFSSPYAAAAVAILHAACPADTPAQLRTRLEASAQDLGTPGRDDFYGAGLVRPDLAVAAC